MLVFKVSAQNMPYIKNYTNGVPLTREYFGQYFVSDPETGDSAIYSKEYLFGHYRTVRALNRRFGWYIMELKPPPRPAGPTAREKRNANRRLKKGKSSHGQAE